MTSTHAYPVAVPTTPLLERALPEVDWADAYAVAVPAGAEGVSAREWAEAVFHSPPAWVKGLFVVREALVGLVGIERGTSEAFDVVDQGPGEVLVGTDQRHLRFRASVLLEEGRVLVTTVVQIRNRRGRAYCAVIRRVHPWVVRSMLTRAARELA